MTVSGARAATRHTPSPASIAKRLKNGEVIADRHDASVIFVDIVGFTKWAAHLNAAHLVEYLDLIFENRLHIADMQATDWSPITCI